MWTVGWFMIISVLLVHWTSWSITVQTWTWFHWMSLVISLGVFSLFTFGVTLVNLSTGSSRDGVSFGIHRRLADVQFWLGCIIACSICVLPYRADQNTLTSDQYFIDNYLFWSAYFFYVVIWQYLGNRQMILTAKENEQEQRPVSKRCVKFCWWINKYNLVQSSSLFNKSTSNQIFVMKTTTNAV